MKNSILILTILMISACKSEFHKEDNSDVFETIAKDELYHDFHEAMVSDAINISSNVYDLEKIHEYWISENGDLPFCKLMIKNKAKGIKAFINTKIQVVGLMNHELNWSENFLFLITFLKNNYQKLEKFISHTMEIVLLTN